MSVGDAPSPALVVGHDPVNVGRGPFNDLVLSDPKVSWSHARLWVERGALWLRDPGSRNGTFIGQRRVTGRHRISDGDLIRFGPDFSVCVRRADNAETREAEVTLVLDTVSGIQHRLREGRLQIGQAEIIEDDGLFLLSAGSRQPLAFGADFELPGGHRLRAIRMRTVPKSTLGTESACLLPYLLRVGLDGPRGAWAELRATDDRIVCEFTATRAELLWVLAARLINDRNLDEPHRGWTDEQMVITAVWGRDATGTGANRLKVLVYRVRAQLESAGVRTDLIQRKGGRIRFRVARAVQLAGDVR